MKSTELSLTEGNPGSLLAQWLSVTAPASILQCSNITMRDITDLLGQSVPYTINNEIGWLLSLGLH